MKRIFYIAATLMAACHVAFGQSPTTGRNFVMETVVKTPNKKTASSLSGLPVDSAGRTVSYFDGLGRTIQTVAWQAGPGKRDVVSFSIYDGFGREGKRYLPYAGQHVGDGSFRGDHLQGQQAYYGPAGWDAGVVRTAYPYSVTVFEPSPLNRVLEQGFPGAVWQPADASVANSGHTAKSAYGTNATGEVALWKVVAGGAQSTGSYAAGRLYKTVSKEENWVSGNAGTVEEFKDLDGRVVLKRVWETATFSLDTRYVYDDLGNLRYVVPPAVTATSFTDADAVADRFVYIYRYDGRKRLVGKKIPGKGWEELIYNPIDQVVFTQDAVERSKGHRSFSKYDALGRVVMTGYEIGHSGTREEVQATVNTLSPLWETRDNTPANYHGYNNLSCPSFVPNLQPQVVNYYDDYNIPGMPFNYASSYSMMTKGLPTASKARVIGTDDWLWTVSYYDSEGRVVKVYSQHYAGGGVNANRYDETSNVWNFDGTLASSTRLHRNGTALTTIAGRFEYDHAGRPTKTWQRLYGSPQTSGAEVLVSENVYNEIGQLKDKKLADGLSQTSFAYNERGWLKSSTNPKFSMALQYQEGTAAQYNGNISGQKWGAGASLPNTFVYQYDKLNRLTSGVSTGTVMSEVLAYDVMGNITSMNRDGVSGSYSYNGHRLTGISGGLATGAYDYDANGNATTDGRTGVTLGYNYLNLPATATKAGLNLAYTYDATGR
ncbi:MAG: RHS repeat protein, partial [Alphaproteobacteria bacterium]